jgi:8-oxo-dGTP pyrophosphatase MutT (NUDIX family)
VAFVLHRVAARVLCFDPDDRLLLIRSHDPADPAKPRWWEIPGGGIDDGETPEDACRRELLEEVGIEEVAIGACVWTHHARFTFAGWHFDQHERIYTATSEGGISAATRLEAFEAMAFEGHRWWAVEELLRSPEPTVPPRLREFLPDVVATHRNGGLPGGPVDITHR